MKQLHDIQLAILKKLLFAQELRYVGLKPDSTMDNNQFDFHLDKMIEIGYIIKTPTGYTLSDIGKEYANRMDTDEVKIKNQAKLGAIVCPIRNIESQPELLIYTRLKQPFFGCQGFLAGKIKFGESITDAAQRELKEETNLEGTCELVAVRHYRVFHQYTKKLLEDKFFFMCRVMNPQGILSPNNEGKYEWVKLSKISDYVIKPFGTFDILTQEINEFFDFTGTVAFYEIDQFSDKF